MMDGLPPIRKLLPRPVRAVIIGLGLLVFAAAFLLMVKYAPLLLIIALALWIGWMFSEL